MMAGGIVMVSLSPVGLVVSFAGVFLKSTCGEGNPDARNADCDSENPMIYGGLLSTLVLVGIGVPLIVEGAKREPVGASGTAATLSPWLAPSAAGLNLRLDL